MKIYTLVLFCLSFVISSCYKESAGNCTTQTDHLSLDEAIAVKKGTFVFTSSKSFGVSKIYLQKNGRYVVGLEQMTLISNTDVQIYLSKTATLSETSVKLFSAKAISGNKYYLLPTDFSINGFDYLLITDDRQEAPLGVANLE